MIQEGCSSVLVSESVRGLNQAVF